MDTHGWAFARLASRCWGPRTAGPLCTAGPLHGSWGVCMVSSPCKPPTNHLYVIIWQQVT